MNQVTEVNTHDILVVDDDIRLLKLLVETLDSIGYRATAAAGGAEALNRLKDQRFDLLITDIKMPDIDGLQLLKEVRRDYADMPVLFISGLTEPETAGSASADGFVPKPFRFSQIEELIENALQNRSTGQPGRIRRVLIVDRDRSFREVLAAGEQALTELDNGEFNVIITEMALTDMSSVSLMGMVRARYPDIAGIVTSDSLSPVEMVQEAGDVGVLGCLKKPFMIGELLALLQPVAERVTCGG
jgi:DNA-binding NtrC family response regulator